MERRMRLQRAACALAALVTLACAVPTYAQTQGMERRAVSRDAKAACKAGDEKTRAECRQVKRHTKQASRQGKNPPAANPGQAPAANPGQAPAANPGQAPAANPGQ
jgi:hypothetical protein